MTLSAILQFAFAGIITIGWIVMLVALYIDIRRNPE